MQVDFLDGGAAPVHGTTQVLDNLARVVQAFRSAGRPVIHVVRLYEPAGSDVDIIRRALVEGGARIVAPGSPGSQIAPDLVPASTMLAVEELLAGHPQRVGRDEYILLKPRWGAFFRTCLETLLWDAGVDTVVVGGCNLPNCPRATLFEASERDFRTVILTDATSNVTPERLGDLCSIGVNAVDAEAAVRELTSLVGDVPGR